MKKCLAILTGLTLMTASFGSVVNAAANANPSWSVDERVVFHGQAKPYDSYGAKDPTIVYYGGKYHVFYTGANQSGGWQMLYTSASTVAGLKDAKRTYMSKIGESYFCAPEVFYYEPQKLWYLVYQDGTYGAAYSTTTDISDPNSWSGPKSFGISGNMGWDYYIICDDSNAYMYNTPSDGSGKLYMRKTSLSNFPKGWSSPTVACSNVFEASSVYKSLADGQYYLLVEAMIDGRSYELFTSSSAGGPWTLVNNKWATKGNLTKYNSDKWTTNVSHGELIRAGYNQKLEIKDINRVDFLIQGTNSLSGEYQQIIWDLGLIRNYSGTQDPPTDPDTPVDPPTPVSAFSKIEAESYSDQSGIQTETCNEGGQNVGYIENGDYAVYKNVDFGSNGAASFKARVSSSATGGNIEIRLDSVTGTLTGTCKVAATGDWQTWADATCDISKVTGKHDVYLKFTGGSDYLFNLNWFSFAENSSPVVTGKLGDLNSDGQIDVMDFALLKKHLLGIQTLSNTKVADLDASGTVDVLDFSLLKKYLLGIITVFPGQKDDPQPSEKKFHCFLLLGQSNMAGYAKSQSSDKVEDPRVLVLGFDNNSALGRVTDQWDVACPPLHASWLDAIGIGDWFGKTMIEKAPSGDTIGLIPCAISGEKIETFMKSGGTKYDWIVKRAKLAQQKGGIIDGIIFHQGESNSGDSSWPGKVKTLVEDLKKDLNLGDVPFLAGELLYSGPCAGHNKLVNQLPSLIKNCYVISADGLIQDPADTQYHLHFGHDSEVTFGKRYAEKMIQALGW
jgi:hypothetical protein